MMVVTSAGGDPVLDVEKLLTAHVLPIAYCANKRTKAHRGWVACL